MSSSDCKAICHKLEILSSVWQGKYIKLSEAKNNPRKQPCSQHKFLLNHTNKNNNHNSCSSSDGGDDNINPFHVWENIVKDTAGLTFTYKCNVWRAILKMQCNNFNTAAIVVSLDHPLIASFRLSIHFILHDFPNQD